MSSPDRPYWTPPRIALWGAAALLVALVFGSRFVATFRPPDGALLDFVQEWLSARNYWSGTPVYVDQVEALQRHTGLTPRRGEELLPWNAHPPAAVLLALPFGRLSYPDAHLAWNLATFPLVLASLWLIARELKVPLAPWSVLPAVALLGVFYPLYFQLLEGQLNPPLLLLTVAAWAADRRDRPVAAGVAAGLAAGLKLFPAFLFAYFLFARRWRALAVALSVCGALNGFALAVLGSEAFRTYAEQVMPSVLRYQSSWRNVSPTGFWLRLFDPHPAERIVPLVRSPLAAAVAVWASRAAVTGAVCWAAWRARSAGGRDRAFAAAAVGMVLVSPIAWTHYFLLLALPVGLLWARLPGGPWRWALWLAVVPLWLPEVFFVRPLVGPEQARLLANTRHAPIPPVANLVGLSVFTAALLGLFALTLFAPARGDEPDDRPTEAGPTEPDEERLNRRLFGPPSGG